MGSVVDGEPKVSEKRGPRCCGTHPLCFNRAAECSALRPAQGNNAQQRKQPTFRQPNDATGRQASTATPTAQLPRLAFKADRCHDHDDQKGRQRLPTTTTCCERARSAHTAHGNMQRKTQGAGAAAAAVAGGVAGARRRQGIATWPPWQAHCAQTLVVAHIQPRQLLLCSDVVLQISLKRHARQCTGARLLGLVAGALQKKLQGGFVASTGCEVQQRAT